MKIFAYVSSYNGINSKCFSIVDELILKIKNKSNFQITSKIVTPNSLNIKECRGCLNCFVNGKCFINDDVISIKKDLEESEIIFIATPVYAHNVSGNLKSLIDRLTYWTHLLHLRGKLGVPIVVSSNNGEDVVLRYLEKIMEYLGVCILDKISVAGDIMSKPAIESVIDVVSDNIVYKMNKKNFDVSKQQETFFKLQKQLVLQQSSENFEYNYWFEHDYFNNKDFKSLFEKYSVLK